MRMILFYASVFAKVSAIAFSAARTVNVTADLQSSSFTPDQDCNCARAMHIMPSTIVCFQNSCLLSLEKIAMSIECSIWMKRHFYPRTRTELHSISGWLVFLSRLMSDWEKIFMEWPCICVQKFISMRCKFSSYQLETFLDPCFMIFLLMTSWEWRYRFQDYEKLSWLPFSHWQETFQSHNGTEMIVLEKQQLIRQKRAQGTVGITFLKKKTIARSRTVNVTLFRSTMLTINLCIIASTVGLGRKAVMKELTRCTKTGFQILKPAALQPGPDQSSLQVLRHVRRSQMRQTLKRLTLHLAMFLLLCRKTVKRSKFRFALKSHCWGSLMTP